METNHVFRRGNAHFRGHSYSPFDFRVRGTRIGSVIPWVKKREYWDTVGTGGRHEQDTDLWECLWYKPAKVTSRSTGCPCLGDGPLCSAGTSSQSSGALGGHRSKSKRNGREGQCHWVEGRDHGMDWWPAVPWLMQRTAGESQWRSQSEQALPKR